MKKPNVTIKDLAKQLNISVSTVSRAMRDVHDINAETKRRVLELAEQLDYQPNQVALSLVNSKTKTIGVIVPNIGYSFFSEVLQGLESEAERMGYGLLLCQSGERYEKEKSSIQNLLRLQVDGFIISLSNDTDNYDHINKLIKRGIPLVVFDRYSQELDCSKVIIDNKVAAKEAVVHLIKSGARNIALLSGPEHLQISKERKAGYEEALEDYNLPVKPENVLNCDFSLKNVAGNIETFWNGLTKKPDGIFAVSDRIAFTAIHRLKLLGLKVPDDVAIIGFNDDPFGSMFIPPLSSVRQPAVQMGKEVVKLLLKQINAPINAPVAFETKILPTTVVIRESSKSLYTASDS